MKKKIYEDYDPSKDIEHKELWSGRLAGTRNEQIQMAGQLANKTGKRVNINAISIIPDSPDKPIDLVFVIGWVFGIGFLLIVLLGVAVTIIAALT
jgi:hypothetical protein